MNPDQIQKSYISDIAIVRLIDNCISKDLLDFFLLLMLTKETIPSHKVVDVHQVPSTEPVLPQPLHQRLQLVTGFQMWRGNHLILKDSDMLVSIQLWRNRQLWYCETKWSFDKNKDTQHHFFVALINCLVCFGVVELFVVTCQVQRSVGDQPKLLIFGILMIIGRDFVLAAVHGEPSDHNCVNDPTAFLHFFHKLLFFCQLKSVVLFLCDLQRLDYSLLKPLFPIFLHESLILINDSVQTCFVYFEKVVSNRGWMYAIVAHNSLRHIAIGFMVSFAIDSAEAKRDINFFCELDTQQLMLFPQRLQPLFELFANLLSVHNSLH